MEFKAFKMDGLGNDFVIIDNREKIINLTKDQIVKICDRNFIGCDQLIFIEPDSSADASLRFFNSDGGESGACGNGTRCVANLISNQKNNKLIISIPYQDIGRYSICNNRWFLHWTISEKTIIYKRKIHNAYCFTSFFILRS